MPDLNFRSLFAETPGGKIHLPVKFISIDIDKAKIYAERASSEGKEIWIISCGKSKLLYVDNPGMIRNFETVIRRYRNGKEVKK